MSNDELGSVSERAAIEYVLTRHHFMRHIKMVLRRDFRRLVTIRRSSRLATSLFALECWRTCNFFLDHTRADLLGLRADVGLGSVGCCGAISLDFVTEVGFGLAAAMSESQSEGL